MKKYFYAVRVGRHPGVYESWEQCKAETTGFPGAVFKKFPSRQEAELFRQGENGDSGENEDAGDSGKSGESRESRKSGESRERRESTESTESGGSLRSSSKEPTEISDMFQDVNTDAIAYVDGSFHAKTGVYGYGVLLIDQAGNMQEFSGCGEDPEMAVMRNVAGEIQGSMRAMEEAVRCGFRSITIFYDYMGIEMWANGVWKTNKEGTRAYREFTREIRKSLEVRFVKVRAHTGVRYNELVDQLAKQAVGNLQREAES